MSPGPVWTGVENLVLTGIRSPDRPVRSESSSGKSSMYLKIFVEHRWNDTDRGKLKYWRKTCPSATLCTTNPTRTELGLNPDLRNGESIFFIQCSPISKKALLFVRFPGFDPLSFWLRADKHPVLPSPQRPDISRIQSDIHGIRYTVYGTATGTVLGRDSSHQCHRRFTGA